MNILEADTNPPLRVVEIDAGELPSLGRDFVAEIFESRLLGIVVRAAFPASTMSRVVERLESGACGHRAFPSPFWQGRGIGPALQVSSPDLRDYFASAREFHTECAALFEGGPDFETRIEELLVYSRAGQPLSVPRGPQGELYGVATIRALTPGGEIAVHCDIGQVEFPAIRPLAAQFDVSALLSYFVTLATPESGGELHVHALRSDQEPGQRFASLELSSEEARRAVAPYGELVVPLAPGDLLVFDAGHYYHHVATVGGTRTRWTQGGFLSRSRDGAAVYCWE